MKGKILKTDEQIPKLERSLVLANKAASSFDLDRKLGALVLYAGIVDFLVIQAARLVEQIILKAQLAEGRLPTFTPNEDTFFYDCKISTGNILKEIQKLLPFSAGHHSYSNESENINNLAKVMINAAFDFLDHRNVIVHQIGNPRRTFEDITSMIDKSNELFTNFREAHKEFF